MDGSEQMAILFTVVALPPNNFHEIPTKIVLTTKNMFSNDKNIETIGQFVELFKHYIGLQTEYVKLDIIEKVVRLITAITLILVLAFLLVLILIYLSFAGAYALQPAIGSVAAFTVIAVFYLLLLVLILFFRKRWIERPVIRFLANLFMDK